MFSIFSSPIQQITVEDPSKHLIQRWFGFKVNHAFKDSDIYSVIFRVAAESGQSLDANKTAACAQPEGEECPEIRGLQENKVYYINSGNNYTEFAGVVNSEKNQTELKLIANVFCQHANVLVRFLGDVEVNIPLMSKNELYTFKIETQKQQEQAREACITINSHMPSKQNSPKEFACKINHAFTFKYDNIYVVFSDTPEQRLSNSNSRRLQHEQVCALQAGKSYSISKFGTQFAGSIHSTAEDPKMLTLKATVFRELDGVTEAILSDVEISCPFQGGTYTFVDTSKRSISPDLTTVKRSKADS